MENVVNARFFEILMDRDTLMMSVDVRWMENVIVLRYGGDAI